jgi:hypothetical protein
MATKKQRRRREKGKRHEYEVVWVDDQGNEVEVEPEETRPEKRASKPKQTAGSSGPARGGRGTVQPPSWRRTARRSLLFAPLMFVTVMLLSPDDVTTAQQVIQTLVLLAFFVPFSYFLDSWMWRTQQKRIAKLAGGNGPRGKR